MCETSLNIQNGGAHSTNVKYSFVHNFLNSLPILIFDQTGIKIQDLYKFFILKHNSFKVAFTFNVCSGQVIKWSGQQNKSNHLPPSSVSGAYFWYSSELIVC